MKYAIISNDKTVYIETSSMFDAIKKHAIEQGYENIQDALPRGTSLEQFLFTTEFGEYAKVNFPKKTPALSVSKELRKELEEALESYKESKDLLVNEHGRINEKITSFTNDLSWRVEEVNSCIERLNEVRTKIADSLYEQSSLSGSKEHDPLVLKWSVEIDSLNDYDDVEFDSPEMLVEFELDDPMNVSKYPMPEEE